MPFEVDKSPLWPASDPAVVAHLTIVQGIVNRMATSSASCKTWCLTLVAALVGLAGATHVPGIVQFAIVPILIFAYLDTMYLAYERQFRAVYNSIATSVHQPNYGLSSAFTIAPATVGFKLAREAFTSWSIWPVYVGLVAAYFVAYITGWIAALAVVPK